MITSGDGTVFAFLRRDPVTARGVEEALGLAGGPVWQSVKLVIETGEPVTLVIECLPTAEQTRALVALACDRLDVEIRA